MKNLQQIDDAIAQLNSELDKDTDFHAAIQDEVKEVVSKLLIFKRCQTLICGKQFTLNYIFDTKTLSIVLIDHIRLQIARHKYKPAIFKSELNENYTEAENLQKLVETIYYYKYDNLRTEDIIEEDDSLWEVSKNQ